MGSSKDIDHREVADRADKEADDLERRSESVGEHVDEVRRSWKQKRANPGVPGANPPDLDARTEDATSPAPQAPPENASPSAAETPPEERPYTVDADGSKTYDITLPLTWAASG